MISDERFDTYRRIQSQKQADKVKQLEKTIAGLRLKLRMARNVDMIIELLRSLQFSSHGGYCPVCFGWNGGKGQRGSTPLRHRYDCSLKKLLEGKR